MPAHQIHDVQVQQLSVHCSAISVQPSSTRCLRGLRPGSVQVSVYSYCTMSLLEAIHHKGRSHLQMRLPTA